MISARRLAEGSAPRLWRSIAGSGLLYPQERTSALAVTLSALCTKAEVTGHSGSPVVEPADEMEQEPPDCAKGR